MLNLKIKENLDMLITRVKDKTMFNVITSLKKIVFLWKSQKKESKLFFKYGYKVTEVYLGGTHMKF